VSPKITRARLIGVPFAVMAVGSWTPVLAMAMGGVQWTGATGRAVAIWYTVPALVATLLVQGPWLKQPILEPLGIRWAVNRWWGIAWLLPVAVLLLATAMTWFAGFEPVLTVNQLIETKRSTVPPDQLAEFERYVSESPPPQPWMLIVMALPAGLTFNLIPGFCEEVAFRGYYFREVPGGFWARSTRIGFLWWLWLAPSIAVGNLYGAPGWWGVALALPWCVIASWVFVYIRVRSESVIAVGIARGTTLALTAAADDLTFGTPAWLAPFYGVSGIAALLLVWLAFWLHDKTRAGARLTTT
jgi:membrane protease YdiL (CAAX protease family)